MLTLPLGTEKELILLLQELADIQCILVGSPVSGQAWTGTFRLARVYATGHVLVETLPDYNRLFIPIGCLGPFEMAEGLTLDWYIRDNRSHLIERLNSLI